MSKRGHLKRKGEFSSRVKTESKSDTDHNFRVSSNVVGFLEKESEAEAKSNIDAEAPAPAGTGSKSGKVEFCQPANAANTIL